MCIRDREKDWQTKTAMGRLEWWPTPGLCWKCVAGRQQRSIEWEMAINVEGDHDPLRVVAPGK